MHFTFDDGYSALVAWLKTLLPIVALGLLSTIFLFSGKVDVTQSLPYAEHNIAEIIREQRITQPYFTGIASNGTEIALSAAYASPQVENAHILEITDLSVVLRSTSDQDGASDCGAGRLGLRKANSANFNRCSHCCAAGFLGDNGGLGHEFQPGLYICQRWVSGSHSLGGDHCGRNASANDRR